MIIINLFDFTLLLILSAFFILTQGVRILEITNPEPVENGTSFVILDCNFIYDEREKNLVLRWFHKEQSLPVYQWILDKDIRFASDEFKPYLDMNYTVADYKTRYRALKIINPTIKLNGKFKCVVSSPTSFDSKKSELIVYAPAKKFEFKVREDDSVICFAEGLFPSPSIQLYRYSNNDSKLFLITKEVKTMIKGDSGEYKIVTSSFIDEDNLQNEMATHYECVLTIPNTNYSLHKTLAFQKGWNQRIRKNGNSVNKNYDLTSSIITLLILFLLQI